MDNTTQLAKAMALLADAQELINSFARFSKSHITQDTCIQWLQAYDQFTDSVLHTGPLAR